MARKTVFEMNARSVYEMLVQKAERKSRKREEVEAVYCWLLGYSADQFRNILNTEITYDDLFRNAPMVNPKYTAVTGVICGVRVEEIEDDQIRLIRCVDKMVDELAKGKKLEKVLRSDNEPANVDEYIALQGKSEQKCLRAICETIRDTLPDAQEILSYGMPTYWKKRNLIHFAAMKKHIGIYPGSEATEIFAEQLKDYDVSKGTIRISYSEVLPLDLIAEIAEWCDKNN